MDNFIIGASVVVGLYILYRLFKPTEPSDFDKHYEEILHSEKYKVKGQYDE